jgi:hypothetical protein
MSLQEAKDELQKDNAAVLAAFAENQRVQALDIKKKGGGKGEFIYFLTEI